MEMNIFNKNIILFKDIIKRQNKILITISSCFLINLSMFSQGSYDWREHSEAMDNMNWGDSLMGWVYLLIFFGFFYFLYIIFKKITNMR